MLAEQEKMSREEEHVSKKAKQQQKRDSEGTTQRPAVDCKDVSERPSTNRIPFLQTHHKVKA